MSWHFSRALAEAYLAENCSDGEPYAPSKLTPTPEACLSPDRMTDASMHFPSGTISEPLTEIRGEELLTWFQAGFRARISAQPEPELESKENEAGSGVKCIGSFAKFDHVSYSWKTHQCSLFGGLEGFSGTWPRWGTMLGGECFPLLIPSGLLELRASIISEIGSGLRLPSIRKSDADRGGRGDLIQALRGNHNKHFTRLPTMTVTTAIHPGRKALKQRQQSSISQELYAMGCGLDGGQLNPEWIEWFMGWPIKWTDLLASGTDKFQQWLDSHGRR